MDELTLFFIVIASVVLGWAMGVVGMMRPALPDEDEPIRLADGWWFPKAEGPPPPAPPAPPSITEGRSRGNMKCQCGGRPGRMSLSALGWRA